MEEDKDFEFDGQSLKTVDAFFHRMTQAQASAIQKHLDKVRKA